MCSLLMLMACSVVADATKPHNQDRPPGPPLSASDALARMQVPPGFAVEIFASEPLVVNPIAFTFDARGRVWVAESVEYPRLEDGPGQDRIVILEDVDGDGRAEKRTVFAEGLNIPSGIALGDGGVYVANSPDLLFLKDTNGDDVADTRETLLRGFGRADTHELPSSLVFGPDGWLYGWNGVFNPSEVQHQGRTHRFTCALWRYHPREKRFELFAEGLSNPWGLDYDRAGEFFASACVIDHLWHISRTGYYHRQAGAYPPHTWKIESIARHKHQKAAYAGLAIYDAPTYPPEYMGKIFMGNIHGGCINMDEVAVAGDTYRSAGGPDFLTAHDAWFMPVAQKVGPDGCLWVLDWYDRYHCYQDARRDPVGIDRLRGRIYRITYGTPALPSEDLAELDDDALLVALGSPHAFRRRWARQFLVERLADADRQGNQAVLHRLWELVEPDSANSAGTGVGRIETLWTLVSVGPCAEPDRIERLLDDEDPVVRAWAIRWAGASPNLPERTVRRLGTLAFDPDPRVRMALVTAVRSLPALDALDILWTIGSRGSSTDYEVLPRMVWRNLEPIVPERMEAILGRLEMNASGSEGLDPRIVDRLVDRLLGESTLAPDQLARLIHILTADKDLVRATASIDLVVESRLTGSLPREAWLALVDSLRSVWAVVLEDELDQSDHALACLALASLAKDPIAIDRAALILLDPKTSTARRLQLLRVLVQVSPAAALDFASQVFLQDKLPEDQAHLENVVAALARLDKPELAPLLLNRFREMHPDVRPIALDVITSRPAWSAVLLAEIESRRLESRELHINQIRKILEFGDPDLQNRVQRIWGTVRKDRNEQRENVVKEKLRLLAGLSGDVARGAVVYERVCAQCHRFADRGHAVGPALDGVGRTSRELLLSNILDPNLVIGADYQSRLVATTDGRVLTGLVVEESPQRIVLRLAGDKLETIAGDEVESMRVAELSLMPEGLEQQMTDQELADLVRYLMASE